MHNGFTRMISALWEDVRLGEPVFGSDGSVMMDLDSCQIELSPGEDGRYVVATTIIGPLSGNAAQQNAQAESLLRLSMLSLTANRGGICIEEQDGVRFAVIRGICPCEIGLTHRLSDVIADLVFLADECRKAIGAPSYERAPSTPSTTIPVVEDGMIFMP